MIYIGQSHYYIRDWYLNLTSVPFRILMLLFYLCSLSPTIQTAEMCEARQPAYCLNQKTRWTRTWQIYGLPWRIYLEDQTYVEPIQIVHVHFTLIPKFDNLCDQEPIKLACLCLFLIILVPLILELKNTTKLWFPAVVYFYCWLCLIYLLFHYPIQ